MNIRMKVGAESNIFWSLRIIQLNQKNQTKLSINDTITEKKINQ